MNFPSIRFVFDRKNVSSRTTKGLVQIEILYQRKRKWIGTGIKVFKHQWDENFHIVKSPTAIEDNQTIDTMMMKVKDVVRYIISENGTFSFTIFNDLYNKNTDTSFLEYVEEKVLSSKMAKNTKITNLSMLRLLKESKAIVDFGDISADAIERFDKHLNKPYRRGDNDNFTLQESTIVSMHNILSKFINLAVKDGYIKSNPYRTYKVRRRRSNTRCHLTEDEMKMWANADVPSNLFFAKYMFLFQCYTGLSYIDVMSLDFRTCIENRNGTYVINGKRKKTNEQFYVVIIRQAMDILERINYDFSNEHNPFMYNKRLKKIAAIAGIEKNISSHIGRHTFAVFALNNGISIEIVAKILGHTDIKTTQIYAKIVDKSVEESFGKLEELI